MASDIYTLANLTLGQAPGGSLSAVRLFNTRYAPPGRRYSYSSADTVVLGLVLAGATQRTLAEYASEKLWVPLGAEADATWVVDGRYRKSSFSSPRRAIRARSLSIASAWIWRTRSRVTPISPASSSSVTTSWPFRP